MSTRMDHRSIEGAQIKVARTSSAKHKADRILIPYTIKQAKPMYNLGSRRAFRKSWGIKKKGQPCSNGKNSKGSQKAREP
jgi:hypothetical protein